SSTVQLFIDGVMDSSGSNPSVTYEGTVGEIRVGRRQGGCCPFPGQIDEMRIWHRARSQAEIQTDMNRTLTGSESGLVAYWRFDEGLGQVVNDSTGRGNDGVLGDSSVLDAADPTWVQSSAPLDGQSGTSPLIRSWTLLNPAVSPSGRLWPGVAYDEAR